MKSCKTKFTPHNQMTQHLKEKDRILKKNLNNNNNFNFKINKISIITITLVPEIKLNQICNNKYNNNMPIKVLSNFITKVIIII